MVKSLELVNQEHSENGAYLTYSLTYRGESTKVEAHFTKWPFDSEQPVLSYLKVLEGEMLKNGTLDDFDDIRAAIKIDLANCGLALQV